MIEKERKLYEQRCELFIDRLKSLFYPDEVLFRGEYCIFEPAVPFNRRLDGHYVPIKVGQTWGKNWQVAWFHLQGTIPSEWNGKPVAARLNLGGEACIFAADGMPLQGLSVHSVWQPFFKRDRYLISEAARGGEPVDLWIEVTAAQLFGLELQRDPHPKDLKRFGHYEASVQDLALALFNVDMWQLYLDFYVLNSMMKTLPDRSVRRARILRGLNSAMDTFREDPDGVKRARQVLSPLLSQKAGCSSLKAVAVGHAHIDTGWLWPVSETVRKCARTFANQISLLEKYPGYVFGASQAQHYAFVKENYPGLYAKIKEQVAAGRWEVQGGMWVEADCNIISGESMVRQILHGKNFFQDEFGVLVRNLWLPDVFGYSAAMPQILQKSGLGVMVTQKISWNQFNRFPHHTFIWRGIDGSEIVVHFPPEDTYNSDLRPASMIYAQENFEERDRLDEFLVLYGVGDGGCGPTEDIIETGLRQQDLESSPRVEFGHAQPLLDRLTQKRDLLHRWSGELYLELHRGTLTTQAFNKKMNRYFERKMRELEALYSLLPASQYPTKEFDAMWKKILINQFHDIIPGSSIALVYETCRREYAELQEQAKTLYSEVGKRLLKRRQDSLSFVNTLSYSYRRPLTLPLSWAEYEIVDERGENVLAQQTPEGPVVLAAVPSLGAITVKRANAGITQTKTTSPKEMVLENDLIRYEFSADGTIARAFDKECNREVMVKGNVLNLFEDRPAQWDAWDVDIFYENQLISQAQLVSWQWQSYGPLLQQLRFEFQVGDSPLRQVVTLAANSKRLDFATHIDWQERHKMLRVAFTVNVFSAEASHEIQYGYVKRPTHRNTSWDIAKFEVVGHRFVDLSALDYGVALLNNCKYGHKVLDNTIDLNLLRSTSNPDPEADQGSHDFTYSLLPHTLGLAESSVFSEAAQLNQPVATFEGMEAGGVQFPCSLDTEDIVLEVLKKAEREDAWILRFYEPRGRSTSCVVTFASFPAKVFETDLMENNLHEMRVKNKTLDLDFCPFEIKTIKVLP